MENNDKTKLDANYVPEEQVKVEITKIEDSAVSSYVSKLKPNWGTDSFYHINKDIILETNDFTTFNASSFVDELINGRIKSFNVGFRDLNHVKREAFQLYMNKNNLKMLTKGLSSIKDDKARKEIKVINFFEMIFSVSNDARALLTTKKNIKFIMLPRSVVWQTTNSCKTCSLVIES